MFAQRTMLIAAAALALLLPAAPAQAQHTQYAYPNNQAIPYRGYWDNYWNWAPSQRPVYQYRYIGYGGTWYFAYRRDFAAQRYYDRPVPAPNPPFRFRSPGEDPAYLAPPAAPSVEAPSPPAAAAQRYGALESGWQ